MMMVVNDFVVKREGDCVPDDDDRAWNVRVVGRVAGLEEDGPSRVGAALYCGARAVGLGSVGLGCRAHCIGG